MKKNEFIMNIEIVICKYYMNNKINNNKINNK